MSDRPKPVVGYTTGIFDLFHIGHVNLLRRAKAECDRLIVGVTTDDLCFELKGRRPVIPFEERLAIVGEMQCVDAVHAETVDDKFEAWARLRFDVIFKGDDWKGSAKWLAYEKRFRVVGVKVHYFPYTQHTSSTLLKSVLTKI